MVKPSFKHINLDTLPTLCNFSRSVKCIVSGISVLEACDDTSEAGGIV